MKFKTIIIYKVINNINGMIYIGQTSKSNERFDNYFGSGKLVKDAIKKFGIENFSKVILAKCNSKRVATELEMDFIEKYGSRNGGYNISKGAYNSMLGVKLSEKHKMKISKANKGKKLSIKHKEKISETNANRIFSDETKRKISEGNKDKFISVETRKKMSKSKIGNKWNIGKVRSEEVKRKLSIFNSGKILTEKHKMKISKSLKGKSKSVEHRRKISESLIVYNL